LTNNERCHPASAGIFFLKNLHENSGEHTDWFDSKILRVMKIQSGVVWCICVGLASIITSMGLTPAYADTQRATAAFDRKDYPTAFREFMESAKKGDAEAQAGVGAMLYSKLNPPGTGIYADAEKWLKASAQQGNTKGMSWLGKFYYNYATLGLERQANLVKARSWFEKAAAQGDQYAMGNLAIFLDGGLGGPRDPARAEQLRKAAANGPTKVPEKFYKDGSATTMTALWQQGRYADAVQVASGLAGQGNVGAQAIMARAYYKGLGVQPNDQTALLWAQKAAQEKNPDGLYILGLMYENGRGVRRNLTKAVNLLESASALGQMEAKSELGGIATALGHGAGGPGDMKFCSKGTGDGSGGCISQETGKSLDPTTGKPLY
ncbi:MAG: tetratricopeptide repeat protein, partial [Nitrospirales bacterium]